MQHKPAPFYEDLCEGPEGSRAFWIDTVDDLRLRVAHFPAQHKTDETARGTIFLFPGRTEYVEKYGRNAVDFTAAGLDVLSIDWRGQGLSDRMLSDPLIGHVNHFEDFQFDVRAMVAFAEEIEAPKPWYLLAHSMGGAIGLRALMEGMDVAACAFSAPMWGIRIQPALRPAAWAISWGGRRMGFGHSMAPGTKPAAFVAKEPFQNNPLTTDRDMWDYIKRQTLAIEGVQLGGPSLTWLNEALRDCHTLSQMPSPDIPCQTYLGLDETIVNVDSIRDRMSQWPGGILIEEPGARHEILMERPDIRARMTQGCIDFFGQHTAPQIKSAHGA